MAITWTKSWSASDDGTVWGGNDVGVIQSDIETYTMHLSGSQTVTGDKNFTGALTISGARIIGVTELLTYNNAVVVYDGDVVYYVA